MVVARDYIRGESFPSNGTGDFQPAKFLLHSRLQRCILNEILDGLFVIFDSSNVALGLDFCLDFDYEKIVAYGREYYVVFFSQCRAMSIIFPLVRGATSVSFLVVFLLLLLSTQTVVCCL